MAALAKTAAPMAAPEVEATPAAVLAEKQVFF
jgi:hypothetical protein